MTGQYYIEKSSKRDWRVKFTRFGANRETITCAETKRQALAIVNRLNRKGVAS